MVNPTLVESKNVENKNEGVGGDLWVRVRARKVSPVFSTFIFSAFLSFDQSRVNHLTQKPFEIINITKKLTWIFPSDNFRTPLSAVSPDITKLIFDVVPDSLPTPVWTVIK